MAQARAHVLFFGRVQGVFFRDNACRKAAELGVTGWVRNLPDGSVEAVFEGEEESIKAIIEWCATSQPNASVKRHEGRWERPTGEFATFDVRI
jgi:acylphosphatase